MRENMSSFVKKLQQLKDDKTTDLKEHLFEMVISPDCIIESKELLDIIYLSDEYFINSFTITTKGNKIQKVHLNGRHPNCNPENNEYCLNSNIVDKELNKENFYRIIGNIKTYYLDDCYFRPPNYDMKLKGTNSCFINLGE